MSAQELENIKSVIVNGSTEMDYGKLEELLKTEFKDLLNTRQKEEATQFYLFYHQVLDCPVLPMETVNYLWGLNIFFTKIMKSVIGAGRKIAEPKDE